ncbi:LADA_0H05490g1_1 [Lachancea dasiensis]|uniref:LADA_0H05490g1_1 n=1 Tax=Lachancea dasiensis TaxID=1072105 RepID=A0A1G4K1D8_9SACH|nr:LADA_0H05490g1_1 [Lachancea dasiensis]
MSTDKAHNENSSECGSEAKRRSQLRSEKRKSEVLIAAQSLDSELQHVKNLKRISIGSLDMLIDPEMEYRVSPTTSQASSLSDDSVSIESLPQEEHGERYSVEEAVGETLSFANDDSIDVTSAEYLQESVAPAISQVSSSGRSLSGVRRGGLSSKSPSDEIINPKSREGPVKQNLLWVPANQHPSVKPENYLELVQDTLHTLKIDKDFDAPSEQHPPTKSALKTTSSPSNQLRSGSSAIVRRPSGLRKSYTELEDLLKQELENDGGEHNEKARGAKCATGLQQATRSTSLRDITEELTRISNRAGFTDEDAVSLARTLSMAGSYDNPEMVNQSPGSNNQTDGELEYASSIFTKGGLAIPVRSSLRRSKFNSYRRRTPSGSSLGSSSLPSSISEAAPQPQAEKPSVPSTRATESAVQSPSSISDFNEIYDHYRQSSLGSLSDLNSTENDHEDPLETSRASDDKSSAAIKDQYEFYDDSLNHIGKVQRVDIDHTSQTSRKKTGWNWFGKKTAKDQEPVKGVERRFSNDFVNVKENETKTTNRPLDKVSHSRHRHHRLENNDGRERQDLVTTHANTSSLKKAKRGNKFIHLFKRNRSSSTGHRDTDEGSGSQGNIKKGISGVLRTRASSNNLTERHQAPNSENRIDYSIDGLPSDQEKPSRVTHNFQGHAEEPITKLQPSVNVTSTIKKTVTTDLDSSEKLSLYSTDNSEDSPSSTVQFEHEIDLKLADGGHFDTEKKTGANIDSSIAVREDPEDVLQKSSSADSLKRDIDSKHPEATKTGLEEKPAQIVAPAAGGYILPPRKLTFDDVMKPERPNSPMVFSDSSFGFPLPPLTISTVVMIDQRLPINVERAIYRLSHLKLGDPKRELRQQVVLSNFMYAYLNLVNHSLYLQQLEEQNATSISTDDME